MPIPFLDLQAQYRAIQPEVDRAIAQVLSTSTYILGPSVERFETEFAKFCGAQHCVAMNSGTAALALLLQAHGIGPGDEVITAANTFFATAEAISQVGALPVFIDCEEETALFDVSQLRDAITGRTKAVIPVHLYGQPCDMDAILEIAKAHRLLVFEDACQAHGATYKERLTGSLADGAAFSFYPGKNLGAYGDGGAVTTDDAGIAEKLRMLRDHGSKKKYHHEVIGWNERMDGIQGAVLSVKLKYLNAWNTSRSQHAKTYRELLPSNIKPIALSPHAESANHLFVVRVTNREAVQKRLSDAGIQTGIHYPIPVHLQPAYEDLGYKKGDFPNAEKLAAEILSLPMYPELTRAHIEEVCKALA